jgi:hypothetical protein
MSATRGYAALRVKEALGPFTFERRDLRDHDVAIETKYWSDLIQGRRSLAGSMVGGIAETQGMLDFCGKHDIVADIEVVPMQNVNQAFERMLKSDVRYRFVIDMASLKNG